MNETILTVVGNVVDPPQRRVLDSGASVTTFRVASTQRRFDRNSGTWVDGDSVFVRVTCWRQLADNAQQSLQKGDPVVVHGRFFTRLYEVEGQRRSSHEVEAAAIGHDLARGMAAFRRTPRFEVAPTYDIADEVPPPPGGDTGEKPAEKPDEEPMVVPEVA